MISQEKIEAIKQGVDLVGLIRSRGIALKKNGKGYKGLCPFHADDKTPSLSVTPSKNLWQCFGCGKGGDVIEFVKLHDRVGFTEAVQILSGEIPATRKDPAREPAATPELAVKEKKLLARVVSYYQHSLTTDSRCLDYLKERGIDDLQAIQDFGAGFVNGTLKEILPDDDEVLKTLQQIGILNKKGNESFYNCIVFPLYDQTGTIVN